MNFFLILFLIDIQEEKIKSKSMSESKKKGGSDDEQMQRFIVAAIVIETRIIPSD